MAFNINIPSQITALKTVNYSVAKEKWSAAARISLSAFSSDGKFWALSTFDKKIIIFNCAKKIDIKLLSKK